MLLTASRYLALVYALGLSAAETIINASQTHWQYAPLWIIDYLMAALLLLGFAAPRRGRYIPILMSAYALSIGVLYIAVFQNYDPDLPAEARGEGVVVALMWLALAASTAGFLATAAAWLPQEREAVVKRVDP